MDEYERARIERLLMEPGWIKSRYDGECISCGSPIRAGQPIRRADPPTPGWIGSCCEETT